MIGSLDERDVIRSEAVQEVLGEVLKQLEEEEAKIDAWVQAERIKASMESTGKNRPSSEGSCERPDFDGRAVEDDDLVMPEVPADETVTDPIASSEE
ncbi:hypothetical protein AAC387_Pa01g2600 [Persea americana]